jgi:hypothetical protein
MRIGRGNRSTLKKSVPVPLCPQQIPHDLTWYRAQVASENFDRGYGTNLRPCSERLKKKSEIKIKALTRIPFFGEHVR